VVRKFTCGRAVLLAAALSALALSACGAVPPRDGDDVTVALDLTTARAGSVMARQMKAQAASAADRVLVTGGHLMIAAFAQAGVAPVVLVDEDVPGTAELSGPRRESYVAGARTSLAALLDQALGLAPVPEGSPLQEQLAALATDGSDPAGMLGTAVGELQRRGGGSVVMVGDGMQRSRGVDFAAGLMRHSVGESVAALRPLLPSDAGRVSIALIGIGNTGGRATRTERSLKAVQVWKRACATTQAKHCVVTPTL
jgi:hypothetical protein